MKMFKLLGLLGLVILSFFAKAQNEKLLLPVKMHKGFGPFQHESFPVFYWADSSHIFKNCFPHLKNIPELTGIKQGIIVFQLAQFFYQNKLANKISDSDYDLLERNYGGKIDETKLIKREICCFVNFIVGQNGNNESVCIIDTNNNNDIGDDTAFRLINEYSSEEDINKCIRNVYCESFINKKIVKDEAPVLIVKSGSHILYNIPQYALADLVINKKKYSIAIRPPYFLSRNFNKADIGILKSNIANYKIEEDSVVKNDEILVVNNNRFRNEGLDSTNTHLVLKKIDSSLNLSAQKGYYAPEFSSQNILTHSLLSLHHFKGKYVFIDFWGTWCLPCRAQIPDLKNAYEKLDSNKITFIGILSHEMAQLVPAFLKKNSINWYQILSDSITKQYGIDAFPTNFLINPNGKIVAKNLDTKNLLKILNVYINE